MKKLQYSGWLLVLVLMVFSCKKPDFEAEQQAMAAGTISDYLKNNFDFSLFAAAVNKAGLADSLDKAGAAYTVLAPTNAAFNKDGVLTAADFDKWPADSLRYFVRTHILPVRLFYSDIPLSSDNRYDNLNGARLYISRSSAYNAALAVNGVIVQSQPSLSTSVAATYGATQLNGVVYPLGNTLKVLPQTVQEFLSSRPAFSHLVAGFKKFGYWDKLGTDGPFTVYAPMDSTFDRWGITLDSISRMDANKYDPVVFGGYFLQPNHLFVLDILQLPPPSGINFLAFSLADAKYKLVMGQQPFGLGVGVVTAASALTSTLVPVTPFWNQPYGNQGTPFLGETTQGLGLNLLKGTYINYTCSNGVVHMLGDILVLPGKVIK
ncbi:fasciclin domain-containing protein [Chitinophaga sp. Cy-1792]|uniref:fasciclin domain-containing protein n=1 Tax=Chitinophaga sp. Cy-1792 TaxID=2608339 RepID=UPI0014247D0E|nr:fasciclin domain-containing protein [Chitinophaga sp. Cy-1792]NIG55414.1 fasciclin domain-containing protein [Chitinophaga sp. Cy-1792]